MLIDVGKRFWTFVIDHMERMTVLAGQLQTIREVLSYGFIHSFIHSFILAISIAPHQVHYYSEALPTTARILCRSFTPKRHRQLRVKDLLKVPTWRLERDSNPRPSGRKASTLPMCHHIFTPH